MDALRRLGCSFPIEPDTPSLAEVGGQFGELAETFHKALQAFPEKAKRTSEYARLAMRASVRLVQAQDAGYPDDWLRMANGTACYIQVWRGPEREFRVWHWHQALDLLRQFKPGCVSSPWDDSKTRREPSFEVVGANGTLSLHEVSPYDGDQMLSVSAEACRFLAGEFARAEVGQRVGDGSAEGEVRAANGENAGVGKPETVRWQDVRDRLERLRETGEPYTNHKDLAERMRCGRTTISKAIHRSTKLKGWMARGRSTPAPRAQSLNEVVADNMADPRAVDPSDYLPDDDVNITMRELIEQAEPEERAKLNAMSDDQKRNLVRLYTEQQADRKAQDGGNRVLGRKP